MSDRFIAIDTVLMPWARSHGFKVGTQFRDDAVRSIWFYDERGNQRAQMWLEPADTADTVTLCAAEFRPDLLLRWGEKLRREATLADLVGALDELSAAAQRWAGPGAFTS